MSSKRKQKIRQSMEALYGRNIEEDRFINYNYHRKRKWMYVLISLFVSAIALFLCMRLFTIWQQGYTIAIGERVDGSRFIGLIQSRVIKEETMKTSAEELSYNSLQTCDVIVGGILPVVFAWGVMLILLLGRASESNKFIKRKLEYDRIQELKEDERDIKYSKDIDYAHGLAPEIDGVEDAEYGDTE